MFRPIDPRWVAVGALLLLTTRLSAQELPGPLVIVGGGGVPAEARAAFIELAGKDKAKVVVVPTASADADDPKQAESFLKPWRALNPASVVLLHTRDRKTADDAAFVKPLTEATAVWFSGGDQSRITAAYRRTLFEKELKKLHGRGGVIGGTSAGAAIMSDPMITGGTETAATGPGLGLLPGYIVDQHFVARNRQKRLAGAVAANPGLIGLGIDEGTAVIASGRTLRVVGRSTVTIVPGGQSLPRTAKTGDRLDLIELRGEAANGK